MIGSRDTARPVRHRSGPADSGPGRRRWRGSVLPRDPAPARVRVVHEGGSARGEGTVLASSVETADSLREKVVGLRFRRGVPEDHALVFRFARVRRRDVDMLFVPFPIDVLWIVDDRVERTSRLRAWLGVGIARADTIIELPAGAADGVAPGDRVRIVDRE